MSIAQTYRRPLQTKRQNRPLEDIMSDKEKGIQWNKWNLKLPGIPKTGMWAYLLIIPFALIVLVSAGVYKSQVPCKEVRYDIKAAAGMKFIDSADVSTIVIEALGKNIVGDRLQDIDMAMIEDTLEDYPSILNAEVYNSIQGIVYMDVELRTPVARLINNNGKHLYIDATGNKFETQPGQSANVLLIRGDFDESISPADTFACETIGDALPVINYITGNEFWNAQITEIQIMQDGELILYPRLGSTYIEFGHPDAFEEKFEKLRLFYDQALKKVGWEYYRKVNIEYNNQIVATRRS